MFTRRRRLDRRRKYTKEFLESFASRLGEAGFDSLSIVLPHNYPSVDPKQSEEPLSAFLERGRNFAGVIFKAYSTERQETLKILFINSNARAIFVDDTFPMAESEPSALYFQSPDPARAYAFCEYFFELLSEPPIRHFVIMTYLSLVSILFLVLQALFVFGTRKGVLMARASASGPWWDIAAAGLAAYILFRSSAAESGLWIKPKRELRLVYLLNMALKGQFRDNPLVQLVITIIGGLFVAWVAKLFGWI
jgi:hypothetical protein